MLAINLSQNIAKKYNCICCDYNTSNKFDFNKHLQTDKHEIKHLAMLAIDLSQNIAKTYNCCFCNKEYKDNTGLWRHKKQCVPNTKSKESDISNTDMITYLMKENDELKHMIMETCKNNTPINNINSNNKTFNLSVFLNEQCKDAMNIMDFVDSLQLQLSDLENVGRLGFVNGISDIIIKNLKALDIHKRPVHCTDLKREVIYVKDENQWEKEVENNKTIRRAIKCIAQKNTKSLSLFKQKHPDCLQGDSRSSDQYNKLIREAFGGGSDKDDTSSENKIISRITKEITIEKVL